MSKLRLSDHNLMIEEGRRKRPRIPREERFCPDCPGSIEDETHFLLNCCKYTTERVELLQEIECKYPAFASLNNANKFIYLMSQEDPILTGSLAKFVRGGLNPPLQQNPP